jgi:hypothetical protein
MGVALTWVARVFAVAMEMVLPGIFGGYLDHQFGTGFLAITGFAIGISVGVYHLVVMTKPKSPPRAD